MTFSFAWRRGVGTVETGGDHEKDGDAVSRPEAVFDPTAGLVP